MGDIRRVLAPIKHLERRVDGLESQDKFLFVQINERLCVAGEPLTSAVASKTERTYRRVDRGMCPRKAAHRSVEQREIVLNYTEVNTVTREPAVVACELEIPESFVQT